MLRGLAGTFRRTAKGVTLDKKPTRGYGMMPGAIIPKENWMYIRLGWFAEFYRLPDDTYMVYVFDTVGNIAAYRKFLNSGDPKASMLLYKQPTHGFFSSGPDPIEEIFNRAPKGLIAVYRVTAMDAKADVHESWESWKNTIYVDMMSVRKGWRRQNLNTLMIQTFKKNWPGREVKFSPPTDAGKAFIGARGYDEEPPKPTRIKLASKRKH